MAERRGTWFLVAVGLIGSCAMSMLLVGVGWHLSRIDQANQPSPVRVLKLSARAGAHAKPQKPEPLVDPLSTLTAQQLIDRAHTAIKANQYTQAIKACVRLRLEHDNYAPCYLIQARANERLNKNRRACFLYQIAATEYDLRARHDEIRERRQELGCIRARRKAAPIQMHVVPATARDESRPSASEVMDVWRQHRATSKPRVPGVSVESIEGFMALSKKRAARQRSERQNRGRGERVKPGHKGPR